jgi:DNA-binding XRE family transcriptional regulator
VPRLPKTDADRVYNRLAVLRAERGVSRRELADAIGVHPQTIGYLERGEFNPSLALALRIGRYFALPLEAIFDLDPLTPLSTQMYGRQDS